MTLKKLFIFLTNRTFTAGLFGLSIVAFPIIPIQAQVKATVKTELSDPTPVKVSKEVDISADGFDANLRKDIVVFVGNVIVKQEDLTLKSDRVTVFYQNESDKKPSITRIDASGSVHLTTKTETIKSTWGIYDFTDKIITLGGKVFLKRNDGEIVGKRLVYNLNSGLISIEGNTNDNGRVKGKFTVPENKDK